MTSSPWVTERSRNNAAELHPLTPTSIGHQMHMVAFDPGIHFDYPSGYASEQLPSGH